MKLNFNERKGITLIALVITIIVLLILAGVTIVTLTGDNGILNQAGNAKDKTAEAEAIERVQLEVQGSYGTDGIIDKDLLNTNLGNIDGLMLGTEKFGGENIITSLPATVTLNGYDVIIDGNGNVSKKVTVADAKTNGTVFGDNTTITDAYGNSVTIPAGFKIAEDSATDVTGGIVIEDATYDGTIGSQFVWIPVGTGGNAIKKPDGSTVEIALSRYTFGSDGTPTDQGEKAIDTYIQELASSTYGNAVAKEIETFKTKANNSHGYYIGRYEARVTNYDSVATSNSSNQINWTGYTKTDGTNPQIVCKGGEEVWNYITQNKASEVSRNMYASSKFTSDLVNSYAWDTAIVFGQTFDNRTTDKTKPYSRQNSLNTSLANTGTNNLTDANKQDKICNIWDMASNCFEWTTETCSLSSFPCVVRGGHYSSSNGYYTSIRNGFSTTYASSNNSFRPLLYL